MTIQKDDDRVDEATRRQFIARAAGGFLGLSALPLLQGREPSVSAAALKRSTGPARSVIYIFLSGGMSQLDTFDPKPGAKTQGPTGAIGTNVPGIQVSEHFPNVAKQMDKIALLSAISSTQGAHETGRYFMQTSYLLRGTIKHPSLGVWAHRLAGRRNPGLPAHVQIGSGSGGSSEGFLGSSYAPLPVGDPEAGLQNARRPQGISAERFAKRLRRLARMNASFEKRYGGKATASYSEMYDQAVKLMGSKDLEAFDISKESEAMRAAYGDDPFGQGCLLARRLVESGTRFVEVTSGGWDTHNENFDAMQEKCPPLDRTLAALLADLECRGLLEETLVVLATEFGRTPQISVDRNGRNHFPQAFTCLLAGAGIRGGQRYGRTNESGEEIVEGRITVPDFNATIASALGLALDSRLFSPSGRPFTVADKGRPVQAVLS